MLNIAIIPAYEPQENMLDLLKKLKEKDFKIVVVDDGSSKETEDIFDKSETYATVLHHLQNCGKGRSIKTALNYIRENYKNEYIVVTLDCDGQHGVNDVKKICNEAEKNPNELIIGKRIRSSKTPFRSNFGNSATRLVYNLATGKDVYDTQTGLRAFSNELIDFLVEVKGERYEYEMNVLLECTRNQIDIKEIEIETIYIDNNSNSHFNTIKDSVRIYKQILIFSCASLISFVVDYLLYIFFNIVFNKIVLSNILARFISATVNYTINRKIVFNSKKKITKSASQYFLLAIMILVLNTFILNYLANYLLINKYLSKVVTEIILFFASWLVQKKIIFK